MPAVGDPVAQGVRLHRVYLGAHYFSDVMAAAAWATAWLVLCVVSLAALARRLNYSAG